jgi:hypothetical protein
MCLTGGQSGLYIYIYIYNALYAVVARTIRALRIAATSIVTQETCQVLVVNSFASPRSRMCYLSPSLSLSYYRRRF